MNVFFREPRPEFSGWLRQASFPADPALQGSARIGRRNRRWISPGVILETAALNHEPHLLTHYLRELATDFHTYYNAHQFLVDSAGLRDARLSLILAVRQVIANGLGLLGVSAPESM